jgi:hypothetical protein
MSLLGSAVALVGTMMLHPTGRQVLAGPHLAGTSHSLALASVPLAIFGFLVLTRRLDRMPNLPRFAFIVYAFAMVAVMSAAVVSGFVAPAIAEGLREAQGSEREVLVALFHYNGHLNRAFAGVHVVASSFAIILWSCAMLRQRSAGWLAILGIVIGALTLIGFGSGHVTLNVHGFGMIAIAHALWTSCVAVLLYRGTFTQPEG